MLAVILTLGLAASRSTTAGDVSALGLADLPEYRDALQGTPEGTPASVGFRDLWDHPEQFRGRPVRVEGRVLRRFRQPAVGRFPALTELWIATSDQNPIGLVFPTPVEPDIRSGDTIRFEGTFLRLIRYPGGDTDRLAPLIVGPGPPTRNVPVPSGSLAGQGEWSSGGAWMVALVLAVTVLGLFLSLQLRRPPRRPTAIEPPPTFVQEDVTDDADPDGGNGHERPET